MVTVRVLSINSLERGGAAIFLLAAMVFILLGISALAIDLGVLYVARSEAQRAADGAALAGAKRFVTSGFLSGAITQIEAENAARQEAIDVAAQNTVGGQTATVTAGDVTFDFSTPANPRIQVLVQRTVASGNPIPTLFARALGIVEGSVSALATAEAFTPSGSSIPVGTGCLKPWILPNCDPFHTSPANPNCPGGESYFVDGGAVTNPGPVASGGVIGRTLVIKPGSPSDAAAPGQFYPIQLPPGTDPTLCPDCAKISSGTETPGGARYRMNISCCNTNQLVCGEQATVDEQTGNMVGPTNQGVACLIHQAHQNCAGPAVNCGQDYVPDPANLPFTWVGGSNNPIPMLQGVNISSSDSVVTVPLYDGTPLSPGESGEAAVVTIVGFIQLFVEKVSATESGGASNVTAHILNVAGCGTGGSGGPGGGSGGSGGEDGSGSGSGGIITGPGGSPFPIRLIRQ